MTRTSNGIDQIDPRAPRFGQAVTATVLLAGIVLREPILLGLVAAVLATAVVSGWRFDAYALAWKTLGIRLAGSPSHREPASPHRFAKLVGATGTVLATALVVAGFPVAGYLLAGGVVAAAGLAAVTGICLGCRMYRHVSFARRLGIV